MGKSSTPSFIVEFKLETTQEQEYILLKRIEMAKKIYNDFNRKLHKIYHYITHCEEYNSLTNDDESELKKERINFVRKYSWKTKRKKKLSNEEKKKELDPNNKDLIIFTDFGFKMYILNRYKFYKDFGLNSSILYNISSNLFRAWDKKIVKPKINCKYKGEYDLMPLKTNLNGKVLNGFNVDVDNLTISYKYIKKAKKNKDDEEDEDEKKDKTIITMPFKGSGRNGILNEYEVHAFYENDGTKRKIKQLAIIPKIIRGKIKFYVQFTMEGFAYAKNRHLGEGEVGIDIGTSTIAVVGDKMLSQHILGDNVESCEKKIARIERKMDRSRRATNPQNFNENGTVKKNTKKRKLEWTYSENYKKLRNRRKNLSRKRSDLLKKSHIELANQLLEYGNVFKVEKNDFASMSKRAKETRVDENGKFKSKKRFGKTISNRAPSQFINILENKVKSLGGEFKKVDVKTACTQFDFTDKENSFKKHELKERTVTLNNGDTHGRDLMSAFNIKHVINGFEPKDSDKKEKIKVEKSISNFNIKQMNENYSNFCEMERAEYESYLDGSKPYSKNFGNIL